jgi:hypothetical protein
MLGHSLLVFYLVGLEITFGWLFLWTGCGGVTRTIGGRNSGSKERERFGVGLGEKEYVMIKCWGLKYLSINILEKTITDDYIPLLP